MKKLLDTLLADQSPSDDQGRCVDCGDIVSASETRKLRACPACGNTMPMLVDTCRTIVQQGATAVATPQADREDSQ